MRRQITNFQCYFNNRGYCRHRDQCHFRHFSEICGNRVCKDKECQARHPRICKYDQNCNFLKKGICAYKHVTLVHDDDRKYEELEQEMKVITTDNSHLKQKVKELEAVADEIVKLRIEIGDLEKTVKYKDDLIRALNEESDAKTHIIENLKETIENDDILKPISCRLCGKDIESGETLEEHNLWTHNVKCGNCYKTFVSESKLQIHVKFDHTSTDKTSSICATCDFVFPTKQDFTVHLNGLQHNQMKKTDNSYEVEDETDDEDFIEDCNFCGRILFSYDALDDHQANYIRCEPCQTCYHNEFQFKAHQKCDIY